MPKYKILDYFQLYVRIRFTSIMWLIYFKFSVSDRCNEYVDYGVCDNAIPRWYFDPFVRDCRLFRYSGCGGTKNRFITRSICQKSCVWKSKCKLFWFSFCFTVVLNFLKYDKLWPWMGRHNNCCSKLTLSILFAFTPRVILDSILYTYSV